MSANRGATEAAGVVTWPTIGSLTNGASQIDTVIVIAPASGSITNDLDGRPERGPLEVTTSTVRSPNVKAGPADNTVLYEITIDHFDR